MPKSFFIFIILLFTIISSNAQDDLVKQNTIGNKWTYYQRNEDGSYNSNLTSVWSNIENIYLTSNLSVVHQTIANSANPFCLKHQYINIINGTWLMYKQNTSGVCQEEEELDVTYEPPLIYFSTIGNHLFNETQNNSLITFPTNQQHYWNFVVNFNVTVEENLIITPYGEFNNTLKVIMATVYNSINTVINTYWYDKAEGLVLYTQNTTYFGLASFDDSRLTCSSIYFDNIEVCSSKGTCIAKDTCKCFSNSTIGKNCEYDLEDFELSPSGDDISANIAIFNVDLQTTNFNCSDLFTSSSISLIGSSASCGFNFNFSKIIISLSPSSIIPQNTLLTLKSSFFGLSNEDTITRIVKDTENALLPNAVITSSKTDFSSVCASTPSSVIFQLSGITSSGKGSLKYVWGINEEKSQLSSTTIQNIKSYLNNVTVSQATVQFYKQLFSDTENGNLVLTLKVTDQLLRQGLLTEILVNKTENLSLSTVIRGSDQITSLRSNELTVEVDFTASPSCISSSNFTFSYNWIQLSGSPLNLQSSITNKKVLRVPAFSFPITNETYQFKAIVSIPSLFITSSVVSYITIPSQNLLVSISGGNNEVSNNQTVILKGTVNDPDITNEPISYKWSCSINTQCDTLSTNAGNSSSITIPGGYLTPNIYWFTLTITKGSRTSESTVFINISPYKIPSVTLKSLSPKISSAKRLVIEAEAYALDGATIVSMNWNVTQGDLVLDSTNTESGITVITLIINKDVLQNGKTYTFQFTVKDSNGQYGRASVSTTTTFPPENGILTINTPSGKALETTYKFETLNWIIRDDPISTNALQYSFAYFDPTVKRLIYLTDFTSAQTIETVLPAGDPSKDFKLTVYAAAKDAFESITLVSGTVVVNNLVTSSTPPTEVADFAETYISEVTNLAAQGDAKKTKQVIVSMTSILNTPTLTEADSNSTTRLSTVRESLLTTLVFLGNSSEQTSQEVSQSLFIVSTIANKPSEITSNSQKLILGIISTSISIVQSGEEVAIAVSYSIDSISNVVTSTVLNKNVSEAEAQEVALAIVVSVDLVQKSLIQSKYIDESASVVNREQVSMYAIKILSKSDSVGLDQSTLENLDFPASLSTFSVPKALLDSVSLGQFPVSIGLQAYSNNPYASFGFSKNVSTEHSVIQLTFSIPKTSPTADMLPYFDTSSEPITICISGNNWQLEQTTKIYINSTEASITGGTLAVCSLFDSISQKWINDETYCQVSKLYSECTEVKVNRLNTESASTIGISFIIVPPQEPPIIEPQISPAHSNPIITPDGLSEGGVVAIVIVVVIVAIILALVVIAVITIVIVVGIVFGMKAQRRGKSKLPNPTTFFGDDEELEMYDI